MLLLHERLPFENWKGEGLSKADRESARRARMPLLYADSSSKREVEIAVKSAVWSQVDRLNILAANLPADGVTWPALAKRLRHAMNRWRMDTGGLKKWEFELPCSTDLPISTETGDESADPTPHPPTATP